MKDQIKVLVISRHRVVIGGQWGIPLFLWLSYMVPLISM